MDFFFWGDDWVDDNLQDIHIELPRSKQLSKTYLTITCLETGPQFLPYCGIWTPYNFSLQFRQGDIHGHLASWEVCSGMLDYTATV